MPTPKKIDTQTLPDWCDFDNATDWLKHARAKHRRGEEAFASHLLTRETAEGFAHIDALLAVLKASQEECKRLEAMCDTAAKQLAFDNLTNGADRDVALEATLDMLNCAAEEQLEKEDLRAQVERLKKALKPVAKEQIRLSNDLRAVYKSHFEMRDGVPGDVKVSYDELGGDKLVTIELIKDELEAAAKEVQDIDAESRCVCGHTHSAHLYGENMGPCDPGDDVTCDCRSYADQLEKIAEESNGRP